MDNCGLEFRLTKEGQDRYECVVIQDLGDHTTSDGTRGHGKTPQDAILGAYKAAEHLLRSLTTYEDLALSYDL